VDKSRVIRGEGRWSDAGSYPQVFLSFHSEPTIFSIDKSFQYLYVATPPLALS